MLKWLSAALIFATAVISHAQSQPVQSASAQSTASTSTAVPSPPDLTVVKFNWSKERIGWERDPFGGPLENFDEMRARARNEKRIDESKRGGGTDVDRIRREAQADASIVAKARQQAPARYQFLYKVSLLNKSNKAIKEVDFDYVFLDAATGQELGRRQFTGTEKIGPGKSKEVSFMIRTPPTRQISVHALDKKERDWLTEQVIIVRILYDDGSVWRQP